MDIGGAVRALRDGKKVAREGWNGKGIYIKMQTPDGNSAMTQEFVYIDTTGLQTDNAKAPKSRVPWLASQTDLLADDWRIVDDNSIQVSIDTAKYPGGFDISVSGTRGQLKEAVRDKVIDALTYALKEMH